MRLFWASAVLLCLPQLASPQVVAFENVVVVPMDREHIVTGQTVIVNGGRITAIGTSQSVKAPEGATRVQADNQYFLMPGLADMHVHIRYETDLPLLIANGVTLARNMSGSPFHLKLRSQIAKGELLGPRIVTSGAQLRGEDDHAKTPQEVRALVAEQAAAGYDFVKVYDGLTKEAYAAIIDEAHQRHMPVAGHVPLAVGVEGALAAHQASIEHAEQYIYHFFGVGESRYSDFDLDRAKIAYIAGKTAAAGTYVTPTLSIIGNYVLQVENRAALLHRPEMRFTHPETYAWWWTSQKTGSSINRIIDSFQNELIKGFRAAGVHMLAGTDYYAIGLLPGYGLHRELRALVDAGLTPYEALLTATRNPAEFLGEADKFGTVAVGKNADLVLVNGNPLDDIDNARKIVGVMRNGRWLPSAELDEITGAIAKSFDGEQRLVDRLLAGGAAAKAESGAKFQESTLSLVADSFQDAKRFADAAAVYELITQAYPSSASAWEGLGDGYAGAGQREQAKESYQRALKIEPNRTSAQEKLKKL